MRRLATTALLTFLAASLPEGPAAAQQVQLPFCSSQDAAQMVMQARPGAPLPDGCRLATVRRLATPAGPLCSIEVGADQGGIVGALTDAVATTNWWTACDNLQALPARNPPLRN